MHKCATLRAFQHVWYSLHIFSFQIRDHFRCHSSLVWVKRIQPSIEVPFCDRYNAQAHTQFYIRCSLLHTYGFELTLVCIYRLCLVLLHNSMRMHLIISFFFSMLLLSFCWLTVYSTILLFDRPIIVYICLHLFLANNFIFFVALCLVRLR